MSQLANGQSRHKTRADVTKTLKWSKTIQRTADAAHITLPSIKGRWFCPVATYSAMVQALPATHQDQPLFVHKDGKPLTVRYLTKVWKDGVRTVGLDPQSISLHSLRKGGATAVYNSALAKDEDIKVFCCVCAKETLHLISTRLGLGCSSVMSLTIRCTLST